MNVKIPAEIVKAIGIKSFASWGVDSRYDFNYHKYVEIDLEYAPVKRLRELLTLLEPHEKKRGGGVLVRDVQRWLRAIEVGPDEVKPRSVEQFCALAKELLSRTPGHRVYSRDEARGVWFCHYVASVEYVKPRRSGGKYDREVSPPTCVLALVHVELGVRKRTNKHLGPSDCLGHTPKTALMLAGYATETAELRADYLEEINRFKACYDKVGKQYLAIGSASDDLDGNKTRNNGWWWRRTNSIRLDRAGVPARLVVDVVHEDDTEDEDSNAGCDLWFWQRKRPADEDSIDEDEIAAMEEAPDVEIPIHPIIPTFDLRRHMRLRVHVTQMTEYAYNPKLGDKLILPKESRQLIEILLERRTDFQDIIGVKGGGAVILCAGPPGTGKTLTSEVFAEVESRPLYSVQASQLGTNEEELEDNLLKAFARAMRWNAILLLDEVDVYAHKRGSDLKQNAIVGVILRVLEYYQGILFMTTNRGDLVDDAIASRCIAIIDYSKPPTEDQSKIWRILADTSGVRLRDETIVTIVRNHPNLSGRDIKQLLKLASMVASARGEDEVLASTVTFVKKFKPTRADEPKAPEADV